MSVAGLRCLIGLAAVAGIGCKDATSPPGPPYLAIVTDLSTLPGVVAPLRITYRVHELSGTLGIDRYLSVAPGDTVILPVPPATYIIDLSDVPATCFIRDGEQRGIVLSPLDNTGIVRYQIQCRGTLNIETATDGYDADASFIYRLQPTGGLERLGIIGNNDSLVFNDVAPGGYTIQLAGIAPNCVVTSDGAARRTFDVGQAGGVTIGFRVQCSRESERPRILSSAASYVLGSSVFTFTVFDPNRDIDGYTWDLTDCRGNSILPDKRERTRRGLLNGRGRLQDTLTVVGAYDIGLPSEELQGKCTEIRVFDFESNTSAIVQHRIGSATGRAPVPTVFNSRLFGTQFVETALAVSDVDDDIAGLFVAVRLRDGALGPPDGKDDVGIMDPAGYVSMVVPNVPTDGRLEWDDVYAVIVWIIDKRGNAIRLEDADIFR